VADAADSHDPDAEASARNRRGRGRLARLAKRLDREPRLMGLARRGRAKLPGDDRYGDPLSTSGESAPEVLGRSLSSLTSGRPGVLRELGFGALQVWQAASEAQGRGRGHDELAILFTDLADYSAWALESGDTLALELLRDVGEAVEPAVGHAGGRVVKRLGDGLMAVFAAAQDAVDAAFEARERVSRISIEGYQPRLRAGVHVGRPRKLGGDYLGVDVNVAARLTERADPEQVLISEPALARLDTSRLNVRRRRFKAKGAPKELSVYSIERE
jgi:adenylate cyclase